MISLLPQTGTYEEAIKAIAFLPTSVDKGKAFESLVREYLCNLPEAKDVVVERWEEWAASSKANRQDTGVDLVAVLELLDGSLETWAVQAKYHSERTATDGNDVVARMLGVANVSDFDQLLIVTSGAGLTRHARHTATQGVRRVDCIAYDDIAPLARGASASVQAAKPLTPRPYQEKAVEDIISGLARNSRVQYISACGTGKTLVSTILNQELGARFSLFVAPRLYLLRQAAQRFRAQIPGLRVIIVCSDITVGEFATEMGSYSSARAADSESLVSLYREYLSFGSMPILVLSTYHSAHIVEEAQRLFALPSFDFSFVDEAHYLVTPASGMSTGIATKVERISSRKTVFATATPRINVSPDGERPSYDRMDPNRFGPLVHKFGFRAAIQGEALVEYELRLPTVEDDDILGPDDNWRMSVALTAIREAYKEGMRRFVTYHSSLEEAEEFADAVTRYLQIPAQHLGNRDSTKKRQDVLSRFDTKEAEIRGFLVANVRVLAEGVDIPSLDAVVFVSATKSPSVVAQVVGRVLRLGAGKKRGHVIVPTRLPAGMQEAAPDASELRRMGSAAVMDSTVFTVLLGIAQHDETIAEMVFTKNQIARSRHGFIKGSRNEPVGMSLLKSLRLRAYDMSAMGMVRSPVAQARKEAIDRIQARGLPKKNAPKNAAEWQFCQSRLNTENSDIVRETFESYDAPLPDDIAALLT